MKKEFLLEIGIEELPAGFIDKARKDLGALLCSTFKDARIDFEGMQAYSTPRRLCIFLAHLEDRQKAKVHEIIGPPAKVAFDRKGKATEAAMGFAKTNNVSVDELHIKNTKKGDYVCVQKEMEQADTVSLLPGILPGVIAGLAFSKSMSWDKSGIKFARPIRWVLTVYNGATVDYQVGSTRSGSCTYGHRAKGGNPINVSAFDEYKRLLLEHDVILDQDQRKQIISSGLNKALAELLPEGSTIHIDDELVSDSVNKTEYPQIIVGSFSSEYLELPGDILVTSMKKHQGFFSVPDSTGSLLPSFISVINLNSDEIDLIRTGNEKVLRSRLEDARFFFETDKKTKLAQRTTGLKNIVFQARLGTLYDKVERLQKIASIISSAFGFNNQQKNHLERTAYLGKSDLLTGIVGEFPELQGIMGREYALIDGEDPEVAKAISEQYLPRFSGDRLPATQIGSAISIVDKLDTVVGCFSAGIVPSGSQDPYALRRQALGVIQILIDSKLDISLKSIIEKCLEVFSGKVSPEDKGKLFNQLWSFFKGRLEHSLKNVASYDILNAVLRIHDANPYRAFVMARDIKEFSRHDEFAALMSSVKRIYNIVPNDLEFDFSESDLAESEERFLYSASRKVNDSIAAHINTGDFKSALSLLLELNKPIADFFDKVLVMTDDEKLRKNRLGLLRLQQTVFSRFADFSRVVIEQK